MLVHPQLFHKLWCLLEAVCTQGGREWERDGGGSVGREGEEGVGEREGEEGVGEEECGERGREREEEVGGKLGVTTANKTTNFQVRQDVPH